ncbi:MAG: hypothetical protein ACQESC_00745 [Nanobdellota archaeon]
MAFVRAKTVRKKRYAYLVENKWSKGKVCQKVKKYLGPIYSVPSREQPLYFDLDITQSARACLRDVTAKDFESRGFSRNKNCLTYNSISINLMTGKIVKGSTSIVLDVDGRFLHSSLLRDFLCSVDPEFEGEKRGYVLAKKCSDCGIAVDKTVFVELYKKLYL